MNDKFVLDFPIPRSLCGIMMGNGNLGAMVWGKDRLHITVNQADFWDHRGGENVNEGTTYDFLCQQMPITNEKDPWRFFNPIEQPDNVYKPQRLPVGRYEFSLNHNEQLKQAELDYSSGQLTVYTHNNKSVKISLLVQNNIIVIVDDNNIIDEVFIKPAWEFPQSKEWLEQYAFAPPEIISEDQTNGWIISCPEDPSLAVLCKKQNKQLIIALSKGSDNSAALNNATNELNKINLPQQQELTCQWWENYWKDIAMIEFPDGFFNRLYKYNLYKFAGATNPHSPIPAGLQGPWIEEYHRAQWSGDYHFNVNIQQIYTLALHTGKIDHLMPLFDMVDSEEFVANMRLNAKNMFGIDDGLLLTHAVDDRGSQCGWLGVGSTLDQACGAWTAQLYWLYYRHSLDKEFLGKRAYPFMHGIMRCYEEMLKEKDGELSIPLSISAEYGCVNPNGTQAGRNPSYQFAAIHMLVKALSETCDILGLEKRPVWEKIKQQLPPYQTIQDADGNQHIAIWEDQDLDECHRHHSHLGAIYPFDTLPEEMSAEMEQIVDDSLDHWILKGMGQWSEWGIPWAVMIQSRMHFNEAPAVLLNLWKEIFINEGMTTVYLPRFRGIIAHRKEDMVKPKEEHEVMQLDGAMASATALLEMVVHEKSGVINMFAGIPDKWQSLKFKNINMPGPFEFSGEKRAGKIKNITIKSKGGTRLKFAVCGRSSMTMIKNGKREQVDLPAELEFIKNETVELTEA